MTEISEAARKAAQNRAASDSILVCPDCAPQVAKLLDRAIEALARVLQEHSDVAKEWDALLARIGDADLEPGYSLAEFNDRILARRFRSKLSRFILPDEPDPVDKGLAILEEVSARITAAIDEIRRKDQG